MVLFLFVLRAFPGRWHELRDTQRNVHERMREGLHLCRRQLVLRCSVQRLPIRSPILRGRHVLFR